MSTEPPLTVEEAAERLKLSHETIRRMLRDGRLKGGQPFSKRAGWRIPASEIERIERGATAQ